MGVENIVELEEWVSKMSKLSPHQTFVPVTRHLLLTLIQPSRIPRNRNLITHSFYNEACLFLSVRVSVEKLSCISNDLDSTVFYSH